MTGDAHDSSVRVAATIRSYVPDVAAPLKCRTFT
jgi:hypothetical protein